MAKQLSISFKKGTNTSIKHNNRTFTEKEWQAKHHDHITQEKTPDNIIIKQEWIRDTYKELFGEAVEQYNQKQTRSDRKITDYFTKVKQDKTLHTQYEFIVQVGEVGDFEKEADSAIAKTILKMYADHFEERNPHFKVYNAVIHTDEATPHLHLNVIPVATGYKQGMSVRPAFNRAMEQQLGITKKGDSREIFKQFREQEMGYLEEQLNNYQIDRKIVGTNTIKDQHEYKALQAELQTLTERKEEIEQVMEQAKGKTVETKPVKEKKGFFGKEEISEKDVIISQEDFATLQADSTALPVARAELKKEKEKSAEWLDSVTFWRECLEETEKKLNTAIEERNLFHKVVDFAKTFIQEKLGINLSDLWHEHLKKERAAQQENEPSQKREPEQPTHRGPSL